MDTIRQIPRTQLSAKQEKHSPGIPLIATAFAGALLMLAGSVPPANAQAVYGSIFGTVTDNTGAVVPNANITVTDVAKGTSIVVHSNDSGQYTAQHLIPDTYKIDVEAPGFSTASLAGVVVYADTAPKADIKLAIGAVANTVTVTSSAPLLTTDRAEVSMILNARAVENLPNLNRNFTAFELLTPGTSYIGWNVGESQNPQRSQQIEVNGQLPFATGYELDGTDNQDPIIGVAVINPTLDSVSEMKVTSQNYDAQFGKAVAGLVTAQTKSGSNEFHGSAFEYRRSDAQQARDPFAESTRDPITGRFIAPNLHNQFGGSVGGPILRDKLFFFGDYQGLREKTGSATLTTVPTALAHSTCTAGPATPCNLSEYLQGGQGQLYDPNSNPTAPIGRTAFAGNLIPGNRISPASVNFFKLLPLPNVAGAGIVNNYSASGSGIFNNDQFDVRADSQASQKLHVFGRYTYFTSSLTGAPYFGAAGGLGFGSGGFAGTDSALDQSIAAGGDYALSPKWLTDFRFGFLRVHINEQGPDYNKPLGNQLGIPNSNVGDLSLNGGLPQFNIDSASNGTNGSQNLEYGTSANQFLQTESQYQAVNNWTHSIGNHTIKFGADLRYGLNHLVGLDNNNVRSGNFHFAQTRTGGTDAMGNTSTGLGFATFLLGDPTAFQRTQTQNTNAQERQKRAFFYGQDQWRYNDKLTFNYGLRWEMYFPETVNGKGQGGLLDLNTGNIRIAGYGNYGTNLNVAKSYTNLAPRIGLAYQLSSNTVIRAGYGRVYGQGWSGDTFGEVLTFSYPTQVSQNLNQSTNYAALPFTLDQGPPGYTFAPIPADGNYPLPNGVSVPTRPLYVRLPTLDAWNLAVQRELTSSMSLQVGYVASHGTHNMFDSSNQADPNQQTLAGFNQINPQTGKTYTIDDRRPYFNGVAQTLGVGYGHPFGWIQGIRYNANQATSSYQALQVVLDKRYAAGVQFIAHYTWSRALTHESYYFFLNPRVGYGPSYYNRPQAFVMSGNWDLPIGRNKAFASNVPGWVNQVIGGFAVNGALTWQSGLPFSLSYANCATDNDLNICFLNHTNADYQLHAGSLDPINHKVSYFTPVPHTLGVNETFGPYARPAVGTFGNLGRNSLIGPSLFNTDLAVAKSFNLTERLHFQLRAEAFNVFNHANLGQPDSCVDCQDGNAGTISSIVSTQDGTSMRRLQFAARLQF
ncbi:MAG: TonB-dependent receptor domain-containing protein [Acidobacteriaceae bacterium]